MVLALLNNDIDGKGFVSSNTNNLPCLYTHRVRSPRVALVVRACCWCRKSPPPMEFAVNLPPIWALEQHWWANEAAYQWSKGLDSCYSVYGRSRCTLFVLVLLLMASAEVVWPSRPLETEKCRFCSLFEQQDHSHKVACHQSDIVESSTLIILRSRRSTSTLTTPWWLCCSCRVNPFVYVTDLWNALHPGYYISATLHPIVTYKVGLDLAESMSVKFLVRIRPHLGFIVTSQVCKDSQNERHILV